MSVSSDNYYNSTIMNLHNCVVLHNYGDYHNYLLLM